MKKIKISLLAIFAIAIGVKAKENTSFAQYFTNNHVKTFAGLSSFNAKEANTQDSTDVTNLIVNPNFDPARGDRNTGIEGWVTTSMNGYGQNSVSYSRTPFHLYQDLKGLSKGLYRLKVHTYYRAGYYDEELNRINNGIDTHLTILYAETEKERFETPVKNLYDDRDANTYNVSCYTYSDGSHAPDGTSPSVTWFNQGKYLNELEFTVGEDGNARIGLIKESTFANDYQIVGGWELEYLGDNDYTNLIVNPGFEENLVNGIAPGWNLDSSHSGTTSSLSSWRGGSSNHLPEAYQQMFDVYQIIENVPNGLYELSVQAFYRTGSNESAYSAYKQDPDMQGPAKVYTYVYLNEASAPVKNLMEILFNENLANNCAKVGTDDSGNPLWCLNGFASASEAFSITDESKNFTQKVYCNVTDGTIRLGIRNLENKGSYTWSIWDNFKLLYLGNEEQTKPKVPYAIWCEDNTTLTFLMSENEYKTGDSYNGKTITAVWSGDDITEISTDIIPKWDGTVSDTLTNVVFDSSFAQARPTNLNYWFYGCSKLASIDGIEYLNTSNVTNMTAMFYGCSSLTSLDVSNFDTSNVTKMGWVFYGCSGLTSLDVSRFDTSNVTFMRSMFYECSGLTTLDVSKFDTSRVTDMGWMFYNCSSLTRLDVSKFDTSNVTFMKSMFYECSGLTNLDVSKFDTSKVTDMSYMFYGCLGLTSLNVSKFDTSNVTDMSYMFYGCSGLTSLNVRRFDTSKVTNMSWMFYGCSGLTSLDVSKINTSNVTYMDGMFYRCSRLTSLDVSKFNTSNVTYMDGMFYGCSGLTSLDVSKFDTSKVTNMGCMFEGCSGLTSLNVSNFDTSNVTDMGWMFYGCSGLTSLDVSNFDTSKVTNMQSMFCYCSGLNNLDLSNFDTSRVTVMSYMFYGCSGLTSINMALCEIPDNSCYMDSMFKGCTKLETIYCNYNWTAIESTDMFKNCNSLVGGKGMTYNADKIDVSFANPNDNGYFTTITADMNRPVALWCENSQTLYYLMSDINYHIGDTYKGETITTVWTRGGATNISSDSCNPTTIVFDSSFATVVPKHFSFSEFSDLTSIEGLEYLNTSNIIDMSGMFYGCKNLTSLDLSHFDTSNVTDMSLMFEDCTSLRSVELSHFNTSKVTTTNSMFYGCINLTSLDLSHIDTSNVTDMNWMFGDCASLTSFDFSHFDTSKVTTMRGMFYNCNRLTTLDLSHFDTSKVTDMGWMFEYCSGLTNLDVSHFDTSNVIYLSGMFYYCSKLPSLDLGHFNTSNVIDMMSMFCHCYSLRSINLNKFDTSNVTNIRWMFGNCSGLETLDLSSFNTSKMTNMIGMFSGCTNLTTLNIANFSTESSPAMDNNSEDANYGIFENCSKLVTIYCNNTWTSNYYSADMFKGCTSLVGGEGMQYDASKTDISYANPGQNGYFTTILIGLISSDDWAILQQVYNNYGGENWSKQWNVTSEKGTVDDVPGVSIEDGRVISINLSSNNVKGGFPYELLNLSELQELNLSGNQLSGDIKRASQANVEGSKLCSINISNNKLSGNIGSFATYFPLLTALNASSNRFAELNPMISTNVTNLDITGQSIQKEKTVDISALRNENIRSILPTVLTYNHTKQNYGSSVSMYFGSGTSYNQAHSDYNVVWYWDGKEPPFKSLESGGTITISAKNANSQQQTTFPLAITFDSGDANLDASVNVLDLQTIINAIFETYGFFYNISAADLWTDGIVNVQDAVSLVNVLLDNEMPVHRRIKSEGVVSSNLSDTDAYIFIYNGQLVINSSVPISAFDIQISTDQGCEILHSLRDMGFTCSMKQSDANVHIVGYSLSGATLPPGTNAICKLSDGTIEDVMLSDQDAQEIHCSAGGPTTDVQISVSDDLPHEVYRIYVGAGRYIVIDSNGSKRMIKE